MISIEKQIQIKIRIYLNVNIFESCKHSNILKNRSLVGDGEIDENVDRFFFIL